jgi:AcrR family transcriptional regulator
VDVILEATARVLSRRGYAGTNTNRIAEIAGVSVGSIYQYFPNKEALVAALRDRHSRDMHILFQRVVGRNAAGSLLDGLAALVGALMQAHREDVALHMILESKLAFHEQKSGDAITDLAISRLLRAWPSARDHGPEPRSGRPFDVREHRSAGAQRDQRAVRLPTAGDRGRDRGARYGLSHGTAPASRRPATGPTRSADSGRRIAAASCTPVIAHLGGRSAGALIAPGRHRDTFDPLPVAASAWRCQFAA